MARRRSARVPDVDRLARSMLQLHGDQHDHDERSSGPEDLSYCRNQGISPMTRGAPRPLPRPPAPTANATSRRVCSRSIAGSATSLSPSSGLGPGHTAVQWNTEAAQRCAHFARVRGVRRRQRAHHVGARSLGDSIEHAVAEGVRGYRRRPDG